MGGPTKQPADMGDFYRGAAGHFGARVAHDEHSEWLHDYKLPCDVMLPPGTKIKAGCSLRTLVTALDNRRCAINTAPDTAALEKMRRFLRSDEPHADTELCKRIIAELMRQNHGLLPGWLLDMAPNEQSTANNAD